MHNLGIQHYRESEFDKAIECFTAAIEVNPKKNSSLSYLVNISIELKEYPKALEYAKLAVELSPQNLELANLCLCLALCGDINVAYSNLDKLDNNSKEYWRSLVLIQDVDEKVEEALANLEVYFQNFGYEYQFSIKKAYYLADLGRFDELQKWISFLEDNLQIQAHDYNNLGYKIQGMDVELDLAIKLYRKAVSLDPGSVPMWKNLQTALGDRGDHEEGISISEEALRQHPKDPGIVGNMGLFLLNAGKFTEYSRFITERSVDYFGFNLSDEQKQAIIESASNDVDLNSLRTAESWMSYLKTLGEI